MGGRRRRALLVALVIAWALVLVVALVLALVVALLVVLVIALALVALVLTGITLALVRRAGGRRVLSGRRGILALLLAIRLLAVWLLVLARRRLVVSLPPLPRRRGRRVVLALGVLLGILVSLVVAVGRRRGGVVLREAGGAGRLVSCSIEDRSCARGGVAGAHGADGTRETGVLVSARSWRR